MIWFLRVLFAVIFVCMVAVSIYASLHTAIWQLPSSLTGDRWFQATLFDAYFGFLTFFIWVAYKESNIARSVLWFVLIMLFGNMAMSAYALIQLFKVRADAPLRDVLLRS